MSIRLCVLSTVSKLLFKQALVLIGSLIWMRRYLDFVIRANGINPKGARYEKGALSHKGRTVPVVWARCGKAAKAPVLLYIHGGGFIFGSADTHKHLAADIAGQLGIQAVLPNYALAPENKYPQAFEDIVTCYLALLNTGFDAHDIIIGGDSAGGNLTFALLAYIKAKNLPMPACAFTFAALTDLTATTGSRIENARSDCVLAAGLFDDMHKAYAPGQNLASPYLSPIYADFMGISPVLLQASMGEILLDDSQAMYKHLKDQGVDVRLSLFDNSFHVFQILRGLVPEANQAIAEVVGFVKEHISKS
jgi:acetyl esterase/lipase